jgi:hypothetical protein
VDGAWPKAGSLTPHGLLWMPSILAQTLALMRHPYFFEILRDEFHRVIAAEKYAAQDLSRAAFRMECTMPKFYLTP